MQNFNVKKILAQVKEENTMDQRSSRSADNGCNSQADVESGIINTETLSASARKISKNVMENMINQEMVMFFLI